MRPYPKWRDLWSMDSSSFLALSLQLFDEFYSWDPFSVDVCGRKISSISLLSEFESSSHTVEPFTLKMHSLEVLKNCHSQSPFYDLEGVLSFESFSFLLIFHDIGKNLSVVWTGSKKNQHIYTLAVLEYVLKKKALTHWYPLLSAVISMDPLGQFLKGFQKKKMVEDIIVKASRKAQKNHSHFFDILQFYYFCDASAYPSLRQKIFAESSGGKLLLKPKHPFFEDFVSLRKKFKSGVSER